MKILSFVLFLTSVFSFKTPVYASQVDNVCNYLNSITSLKAKFTQIIDDNKSEGVAFFKKPSKVLVDYQKGDVNAKILINDQNVIFLDKKTEQITHLEHGFYNFFNIFSDLKLCQSGFFDTKNDGICIIDSHEEQKYKMCLRLKPEESLMFITIDLIHGDGKLNKVIPYSQITFRNLKINIDLHDDIFKIQDPRFFKNEF